MGTHIGQLLCFARIDWDLVFARIFTDNHSFVDLVARLDQQASSLLHHVQRIGNGFAVFHADQRSVFPRSDFATIGAVLVKEMAHHTKAAGHVDKVGFEPDQSAHGDEGLDADLIGIPYRVTIGKKIADGMVELFDRRAKQSEDVKLSEVLEKTRKLALSGL